MKRTRWWYVRRTERAKPPIGFPPWGERSAFQTLFYRVRVAVWRVRDLVGLP